MPHKRKSRLNVNQKNSATRRVQSAIPSTAPPHVTIGSCLGIDVEIPMPDSSKKKSGGFTSRRHFPVHKQNDINIITQITKMLADTNVSPEAAAAIAPKVTQKMNFPPDQTVFKNLVPLNVNDSVLEPLKLKRVASKDKPTKESEPSKVSNEPQLADYVEKVDPIAMSIKEPELRLDYTQEPFDFLGAYRKVYH
ncbi:uncharacterized protein LOC108149233 [Drosophila elegans]|uniref:uncharacterized protein LOC108149233 n=1 Tax=Drosophila elegans TaxID=30023 RepID=UPI0007E711EB|nr:uncharacterized protein LOC108149233 [Drosophila elegans]